MLNKITVINNMLLHNMLRIYRKHHTGQYVSLLAFRVKSLTVSLRGTPKTLCKAMNRMPYSA